MKTCQRCQKEYSGKGKYFCSLSCIHKGRKKSEDWKKKASLAKLGVLNPNYKDNVGYKGLHDWLNKYFKKTICENPDCKNRKPNVRLEWALILGRKYERKKENFISLCRSCHAKYDKINIKV